MLTSSSAAPYGDIPYRASQYPAEFDVWIDSTAMVWTTGWCSTWMVAGNGPMAAMRSGAARNFPRAAPSTSSPTRAVNTQNWILTVPASAIGVAPGQAFNFQVMASQRVVHRPGHRLLAGRLLYPTIPTPWACPSTLLTTCSPTVPAQDHLESNRYQGSGWRCGLPVPDRPVAHVPPGYNREQNLNR